MRITNSIRHRQCLVSFFLAFVYFGCCIAAGQDVNVWPPIEDDDDGGGGCSRPFDDIKYNCAELSDGIYCNGCRNYVWICMNGFATRQQCPGDLLFDSSTGKCDYRSNIAMCRDTQSDEPSWLDRSTDSGSDFECAFRADGSYADDSSTSSNSFYYCWDGVASAKQKCPAALVFDRGQCVYANSLDKHARRTSTVTEKMTEATSMLTTQTLPTLPTPFTPETLFRLSTNQPIRPLMNRPINPPTNRDIYPLTNRGIYPPNNRDTRLRPCEPNRFVVNQPAYESNRADGFAVPNVHSEGVDLYDAQYVGPRPIDVFNSNAQQRIGHDDAFREAIRPAQQPCEPARFVVEPVHSSEESDYADGFAVPPSHSNTRDLYDVQHDGRVDVDAFNANAEDYHNDLDVFRVPVDSPVIPCEPSRFVVEEPTRAREQHPVSDDAFAVPDSGPGGVDMYDVQQDAPHGRDAFDAPAQKGKGDAFHVESALPCEPIITVVEPIHLPEESVNVVGLSDSSEESDFSDIYAVQQDRPVGYDSYGAHYDAPDSPDLYYIQQHPGPVASDVFNSNAETMYGGDGISLKVNADAPEENVDAAEATEVENSGAGSGTDDARAVNIVRRRKRSHHRMREVPLFTLFCAARRHPPIYLPPRLPVRNNDAVTVGWQVDGASYTSFSSPPVYETTMNEVSVEDFPSWSPITTTSDEEELFPSIMPPITTTSGEEELFPSIMPPITTASYLYPVTTVRNLYNQRNRTKSPFAESGVELTSLFCFGREDAFYRHPADCSGIVQCFGNYLFVYSSCGSGLVFNEATSKCDYSYNVRECSNEPSRTGNYAENAEQEAGGQVVATPDSDCSRRAHGEHLRDPTDCTRFIRCVWGRREVMTCPATTVFNSRLNVCDYPSAVPECNSPMTS